MSTIREDAQGSDLAPSFGDLSKSEKRFEIKPPLELLQNIVFTKKNIYQFLLDLPYFQTSILTGTFLPQSGSNVIFNKHGILKRL